MVIRILSFQIASVPLVQKETLNCEGLQALIVSSPEAE